MTEKMRIIEGLWFAVPLRDSGYAIGVISRVSPGRGVKTGFGYFFGQRYKDVPSLSDIKGITPQDSIAMKMFSGLGFKNGTWLIIGVDDMWVRENWPMPAFARQDAVSGAFQKIRYDDHDPRKTLYESPCSRDEALKLPRDGLSGYGAVELVLTALINGEPVYGHS
ncbi:immunity 26/phosphotriesterase HocA family protein [Andreprevotia chitinilytica]|uniref:immunity 26/phosphotriesterase HocA family protein n=1 Tax=Andreprevotia chitinilytica TaxID=396808 RepID=UPI000557023B|nr:immunity 26/phosphotriesterase HocA family protein [Andreprevotia chitinilytica]